MGGYLCLLIMLHIIYGYMILWPQWHNACGIQIELKSRSPSWYINSLSDENI